MVANEGADPIRSLERRRVSTTVLSSTESSLISRGVDLLSDQDLVTPRFHTAQLIGGKIFLVEHVHIDRGAEHRNQSAIYAPVSRIHVFNLDGHYLRSAVLKRPDFPNRFKACPPAITVTSGYFHVRDYLFTGSFYVDHLFSSSGQLIAAWTDDPLLLESVIAPEIPMFCLREGPDSSWTMRSPFGEIVGDRLVHQISRKGSSLRIPSDFLIQKLIATDLSKLATFASERMGSPRDSVQFSHVYANEIDSSFTLESDSRDATRLPWRLDRLGVWCFGSGERLSYIPVEKGMIASSVAYTDLSKLGAAQFGGNPQSYRRKEMVERSFLSMGSGETLVGTDDADCDGMNFSQWWRHSQMVDLWHKVVYLRVTPDQGIVGKVYEPQNWFLSQIHESGSHKDARDVPSLHWRDLTHFGVDEGKMVSTALIDDERIVNITDFLNESVHQILPKVPSSVLQP